MKAIKVTTPDGYVIEGEPDQVNELLRRMEEEHHQVRRSIEAKPKLSTKELIRTVLKRRPIELGQQDLLSALYRAGSSGMSGPDLATTMGRKVDELAGVLGGLGKRVNGTEGVPANTGISLFLDIERVNGRHWHYTLLPEVREVLEEEDFAWL